MNNLEQKISELSEKIEDLHARLDKVEAELKDDFDRSIDDFMAHADLSDPLAAPKPRVEYGRSAEGEPDAASGNLALEQADTLRLRPGVLDAPNESGRLAAPAGAVPQTFIGPYPLFPKKRGGPHKSDHTCKPSCHNPCLLDEE